MGRMKEPPSITYTRSLTRQSKLEPWGLSLAENFTYGGKEHCFPGYTIIYRTSHGTVGGRSDIHVNSVILSINGISILNWGLRNVVELISNATTITLLLKGRKDVSASSVTVSGPYPPVPPHRTSPSTKISRVARKSIPLSIPAKKTTSTSSSPYPSVAKEKTSPGPKKSQVARKAVPISACKIKTPTKKASPAVKKSTMVRKVVAKSTPVIEKKTAVTTTANSASTKSSFFGSSAASQLAKESFTDEQYHMFEKLTTQFLFYRKEAIEAIKATVSLSLDACINFIHDRRFQEDLDKAQILSEKSTRLEKKIQSKQADEKLKVASNLTNTFPTSVLLSNDSQNIECNSGLIICNIMNMVGNLKSDNQLRDALTQYLKLEAKAIHWYEKSAKAYAQQVSNDLNQFLQDHLKKFRGGGEIVSDCLESCCSCNTECTFVARVREEVSLLSNHLYSMPESSGGVPIAFLDADDTMCFSLEDDGFEVVD